MIERFSPKQAQILKFAVDNNSYLICDGAVRAGKTVVMVMGFVIWAMEHFDDTNFAICGKTVASAERNIITPLMGLEELPYIAKYNSSKKVLTVKCGNRTNRFYVFGGKDESSYTLIQGITLAGVMLDEVALMPKSFVDQAIARTTTFANKKIWFNCNPEGQLHWFNQGWIKRTDAGELQGARHLHFTMHDNPILGEEEIRKAGEVFTGVFYDRYILGLWVAAEGIIYDMFATDIHVVTKTEDELEGEYYVSSDFGIQNANVFLLWRRIKNTSSWFCVNEYYYSGRDKRQQKTVSELADGLQEMLGNIHPKQIIIDPSAAAMITELRKRGYTTRQADNDVLNGISDVGSMLKAERLYFSPKCKRTIEEFGVYSWDEKASQHGEDKPIKENDHAMDAVRYFVRTLKLAKRDTVENKSYLLLR